MSEQNGPTKTETMLGGVDILVTTQCQVIGEAPVMETVKVKQLPVKQYPAYLAALDDETAMAALLTGKTQDWVENLDAPSHELLVSTGDRINRDFFGRWAERQRNRRELLVPGLSARMLENLSPRTVSQTLSPR
jgi:hypothetical protein